MSDQENGYQDFLNRANAEAAGMKMPSSPATTENWAFTLAPQLKAKLKTPLVHESVGKLVKIQCSVIPLQIISLEIAPTLANDPDLLSTYIVSGVNQLIYMANVAAGKAMAEVMDSLKSMDGKPVPEILSELEKPLGENP